MAGGAYAIVVALNGGPSHQMTGAATQIPASVGTSAPRLTSAGMARPLPPELRLITCGGPFDSATGQYLDNIIVYSHLIS
jgi:hypothetical protein